MGLVELFAKYIKRQCHLCREKKPIFNGEFRNYLDFEKLYDRNLYDRWNRWTCDNCFVKGTHKIPLSGYENSIFQKTVCKWCGEYFFCVRRENGRSSLFCSQTCALSLRINGNYQTIKRATATK